MTLVAVKTRFAPSPTGYLHLGNVRTALFSALYAKGQGGTFLLRIEDTDEERSQPAYVTALLEDLHWLGLDWQEGPEVGGPHAPYAQSERGAIYADYYQRLEAAGHVYPCFCTPAELALSRKRLHAAGKPPRYTGTCARLSAAERADRISRGLLPTLRFRVPAGQALTFTDVVRGPQRFLSDDIGDFVIRRADGTPQFFFANAVDDALMGVTHVLRGEDHLANTPRQQLLLAALGLPIPCYGHLALIVGHDGGPLSKREGDIGLRALRAQGYWPEAVLNYLARVGHTYTEDGWLSTEALAKQFALDHLGRAPARYDAAQLLYWQHVATRQATPAQIWDWIAPALPAHVTIPPAQQTAFAATVQPNIAFPTEAVLWAERLFGATRPLTAEGMAILQEAGAAFFDHAQAAYTTHGVAYQPWVKDIQQRTGRKGKALFMPLRVALTGETHGPELARVLALLPEAVVRERLAWPALSLL